MSKAKLLTGMKGFTLIWFGQVISQLGTAMTRFTLTIWTYTITQQVTATALVLFCSFMPSILLSPIAGALVDRCHRKLILFISDLGAGLGTICLLILYATNTLEVKHLYLTTAITSIFESFQFPAYYAAVSLMLSKAQYSRASGMLSLWESISGVFAPLLAGFLFAVIGIKGIMTIDIFTFLIAISALLFIHIPQPEKTGVEKVSSVSLWQDSIYGFRYIFKRPSFSGLVLIFFTINVTFGFYMALFAPMILARTNNNQLIFGSVCSAFGIGGIAGGLLMGYWGGPRRKIHGVLLGIAFTSLLGTMLMGLGQNLPVWATAAFFTKFFPPIIYGCNQAIWQAKVSPDLQGRVFGVQRQIGEITMPLAIIIAGPLTDYIFEPAMQPGGSIVLIFGGIIGIGPGAGMGLVLFILGLLGILIGLSGYLFKIIKNAEDILPDHNIM
ncbi:MFS transporter [Nostoc sp. DedQUE09]|uniref:MFS transporter n=1 Tax=Nostoc sp. DedQUE09 TaxID=3075394 RepID=UPI002AD28B5B|nr:MFS transporter [Nostoc sp. DedQUE09]MDZ7950796.1 MFS transporter [Nostoc sp. DedQUE09]